MFWEARACAKRKITTVKMSVHSFLVMAAGIVRSGDAEFACYSLRKKFAVLNQGMGVIRFRYRGRPASIFYFIRLVTWFVDILLCIQFRFERLEALHDFLVLHRQFFESFGRSFRLCDLFEYSSHHLVTCNDV